MNTKDKHADNNAFRELLRGMWGWLAAFGICIVISIAFFHPDAMQGHDLQQADMLQGAANGKEISDYEAATGEKSWWTNALFGGMPTFQISPTYPSDSWFKWIDVVMRAGLPAPSGYLFSMMLGFLILCMCLKLRWYYGLIGAISWGLSSYFIIIIGAGHLWKFFTLTYVPPVIGGIILAYRGKWLAGSVIAALFAMMQISANHAQMSYYFLFLVLGLVIAYFVVSIIKKSIVKWAIASAALLVAGALAVFANMPSLVNTYKYSKETMRGQHSLLTVEENPDQKSQGGLDKAYITQYSYGQAETFTLLIPNVKGGASAKPIAGHMEPLSLSDLKDAQKKANEGKIDPMVQQYLGYVSQYFGEPEGTNGPVYVGAIICALFLLGCCIVRGPLKWTLLTLTVLSILLALGRNAMWLTDFFIDYVPMYNKFRTPESILVIAEFTMPLLGILGLAKFFSTEKPFTTYKKSLFFAFGLPLFFCLLGVLFPAIYGSVVTDTDFQISSMISQQLSRQGYPAEAVAQFSLDNPAVYVAVTDLRHSMIESDSWRSLIFILVSLAAMWGFSSRMIPKWIAITAVGVLILGDLYTADKRYLDHDSFVQTKTNREASFPMSETDRAILADTTMNYRVMDIPHFWQPAPSYYHKTVGGYHAAKLTRYQDIIDRHLSPIVSGSTVEADWNVLDMLNAKYIIGPSGELVVNPHPLGNAWLVNEIEWVENANEEMDALSYINPAVTAVSDIEFRNILRAPESTVVPGDTIFETSYAPNRLTYHANVRDNSVAVFSEIWFPWGWEATVDGEPVEIARVDYILRAINIPSGSHTVEMRFDPPTVRNSVIVARFSIVIIYLLVMLALGTFYYRTTRRDNP